MCRSVGVDAGGLDDRRPPVDLGGEPFLQGLGRRRLGRNGGRAELGEALDHVVVRKGLLQGVRKRRDDRSEETTSELQSLMRISYAVFCLKKKQKKKTKITTYIYKQSICKTYSNTSTIQ